MTCVSLCKQQHMGLVCSSSGLSRDKGDLKHVRARTHIRMIMNVVCQSDCWLCKRTEGKLTLYLRTKNEGLEVG